MCQDYLRDIVANSAPISERLVGPFTPADSPKAQARAEQRAADWRAKVAAHAPHAFEKRLDWLGTTPQAAAPLLGDLSFDGPLPRWAELLDSALHRLGCAPDPYFEREPFAPLLAPFVNVARDAVTKAFADHLTPRALEHLLLDLAQDLSHLAAPVFLLRFDLLRDQTPAVSDRPAAKHYTAFITQMQNGGLLDVFKDYPVLARLMSILTEHWITNATGLAQALRQDNAKLGAIFAPKGCQIGPVIAVRPGLSDRHNQGKTVSILEFASGAQLVFKPRNVAVEVAWFDLLAQLNGFGCEFACLRALDRGTHGWVEVAQPADLSAPGAAKDYYRRAGQLLCVLYALEASDCFFENIIAAGDFPMLIDMETLMHHVLRRDADLSAAEEIADDLIFNSVFRAGFLPTWEMGPSGHVVDISGLGAVPGQATSYIRRRWTHVNTDAMTLGMEQIEIDSDDHLPKIAGDAVPAADHVEDVILGFRQAYAVFQNNRADFVAKDGVLSALGRCEIRWVFHATRIYGLVLKRLGAPRYLRNGADRSIALDVISRFYLDSRRKDRFFEVLAAEIHAMETLDIPKFTVAADSRDLTLPTGKVLGDIFEDTAIARVHRRIDGFCAADQDLQVEFISASLDLAQHAADHSGAAQADSASELEPPAALQDPAQIRANLIVEAQVIADQLTDRHIRARTGGVTWIAPQLLTGSNRYELSPMRLDLYGGLAGVAVFFAGLSHITGRGSDMATHALLPLRQYLETSSAEKMVRDGYNLGAATGVGSFVASLCWCADLLAMPELLDDAKQAADQVSSPWIQDDDTFDVLSGSAGAIFGLLALYARRPDAQTLAMAVACGDHLLANAKPAQGGLGWQTLGEARCFTGFSHGAAGIAAALFRLAHHSGHARFAEAAEAAVAFEAAVFDADHQNWPDFRNSDTAAPQFMHTWCHGAPGIGLARAACGAFARTSAASHDIAVALDSTLRFGVGGRDGLCCGALGRADLFLMQATEAGDNRALSHARDWAAQVVARRHATGGYALTGKKGQDFFDPSFFQGLSGIGYQLLRTAHPDKLPSVLAWM